MQIRYRMKSKKNAFEIALKAENGHVSNAKFRLSLIIALKTQSTKMFEKERVILQTNLIIYGGFTCTRGVATVN